MQLNETVYKSLKWSVALAALLGGLLLGGCDGNGRSQPPPQVPEVAVVTVQSQKVVLTTELPGRTAAFRIAEIRPQVSGLIQKRLFTEGSDVKAGQILYQIDPAEFGHGRTRNLGVSLSTGDIVCLLTQDALPSDPHIIRNLIRHFERDDVAGVVGRQIPRPDASLLTTLSVNNWVLASPEVHVSQITSQDTFEQSSPYEQYLACVFDNVCSAIRRSVWERIPFPDVVFSEDLEWGYRVLRSGYAIVYEPDAAVYHSHDRPIVYQFHRTRIDHYRLAELFGLETVPTVFHIPGSIMHQILGEARALARMNAPFWRRFRETLKLPARAVAHVFAQYTGARAYRMGQPPEDLKAV